MKTLLKSATLIFSLLVIITLVGCSIANKQAASTEQKPQDTTTQKESRKLVVDLANESSNLDPGLQYNFDSYSVYRNIFDNLIHRDPKTNKFVPWVAESWKQDSPTTWTFKIRGDIKFHNGDALTAEDVAFSIQRILDKDFRSPQYANFNMISSAKAEGSDLKITTDQPSPTLLTQLVNLSIVPQKYVKEKGNDQFNLNPVGSGAYQFESWAKGTQITLKANASYWGGKPEIPSVEYRFVSNPASRVADLQSGKADFVSAVSPDDVDNIKSKPELQVFSTPTERVAYLAFNMVGDTPTKSSQVNQAIAYGINYDSLITSLLHGYGKPVTQVLTPLSFGYDTSIPGYSYNPEKAKALLKEAGHANGITLDFATSPSFDQRIVQAVQGDLDKIGVKVNIVSTDQATYLKKVQDPARKWGSIRMGIWSCSCMDADGTILPLFRTGTIWSSYTNPAFDQAVDAARTTTDEAVRTSNYKKALNVLQNDVPGIGLYQAYALYGASKQLQWQPDPQENFFVKDMKWSK
ncbi:peptide/nickel transport system substrate-binding protein [Paenibacillus sp. 1_12]|uniref:ABC transporter substrate-binding protein n=1 Tax=Paenibacillus sp. 1_12 TaxID=1566278 RepID=UPI0008E1B355|nr:ABC transporter substrate-binding protein [Paenibacillus sp. 1_12]SFL60469.1 peptide/nickel transport system substrate-binding protein [Paenibacillus sp. 1_12]